MSRPRFRLRTLLIWLVATSILLAWLVAARKGAQALGFLFPGDAVYLTVELPRNDLETIVLFAMHGDEATPASPYVWKAHWYTVQNMIDLRTDGGSGNVEEVPAAWTYSDRYLVVGRDLAGDWHRWSFPAAGNVRVVWSSAGPTASVRVPEDAADDPPTRDELLALGIDEWTIDGTY